MKIKHIVSERHLHPVTIDGTLTVQDAVNLMAGHKIGAVIVVDRQGLPEGILSERDIVRLASEQRELRRVRVKDAMSTDLVVGNLDDDVEYIMNVITQRRVRHIPLFDGQVLQGIISIGDVLKSQLKETQVEVRYLKHYLVGEPY